jgi:hypothetical protein
MMDGKRRAALPAAAAAALIGGWLLLGRHAPAGGLTIHFWFGLVVGVAVGLTVVAAILFLRGRSARGPR